MRAPATLAPMLEEEIRERLKNCLEEAMKAGKFQGATDLSRRVSAVLEQTARSKGHNGSSSKRNVSDQTASNWIKGRNIPDWDVLPALARVIGVSEDFLLFGPKRGDQIKKERVYLSRISDDEGELLTAYREASKSGRRLILRNARAVAEEQPAPYASVHPLRRKEDKLGE